MDEDFDLYGLKLHFLNGYCEDFNSTEPHLCECGHEVKEEGNLCTDCQRAMKN